MGPGRWEVIIWNSASMDYIDSCMYASYFGIVQSVQRGS